MQKILDTLWIQPTQLYRKAVQKVLSVQRELHLGVHDISKAFELKISVEALDIFAHEKVDTQLIILEFKAEDGKRLSLSQNCSPGNRGQRKAVTRAHYSLTHQIDKASKKVQFYLISAGHCRYKLSP